MAIEIGNLASASFMPGLQNSGQVTTSIQLTGSVGASPNFPTNVSNLVNPKDSNGNPIPAIITLDDPSVIAQFMVNFPDGGGELATRWFPIAGTGVFYDYVNNWQLILYMFSHPQGRAVYFNFINMINSGYTLTNFTINISGHLYSYPWLE